MNLGRRSPRINVLSSLYPSERLQTALCDYYAAIVRLCKHTIQYLRKPGVYICLCIGLCICPAQRMTDVSVHARLFSVSFDQEFGPFERDIRQFAQEIGDEASLASKQAQQQENELQAQERSEASKHRTILVQVRDSLHRSNTEDTASRLATDRRRMRKKKMQALDSLSTYDYHKTYKQTRKECVPGTSNWILETSEFETWEKGTSEGLWCSGKCKVKENR